MNRQPLPIEQRFWSKVDRRGPDECWPWLGKRNHKGYGNLSTRLGLGGRRCQHVKATHVAWQIAAGQPWPEGKIALHSCDNPPCVNPAHIRPGTHKDNALDRKARGRLRGVAPYVDERTTRPPRIFVRVEYCIRCGHHRTDDLWNGTNWRCRPCFKATAKRARDARRALRLKG